MLNDRIAQTLVGQSIKVRLQLELVNLLKWNRAKTLYYLVCDKARVGSKGAWLPTRLLHREPSVLNEPRKADSAVRSGRGFFCNDLCELASCLSLSNLRTQTQNDATVYALDTAVRLTEGLVVFTPPIMALRRDVAGLKSGPSSHERSLQPLTRKDKLVAHCTLYRYAEKPCPSLAMS